MKFDHGHRHQNESVKEPHTHKKKCKTWWRLSFKVWKVSRKQSPGKKNLNVFLQSWETHQLSPLNRRFYISDASVTMKKDQGNQKLTSMGNTQLRLLSWTMWKISPKQSRGKKKKALMLFPELGNTLVISLDCTLLHFRCLWPWNNIKGIRTDLTG